ncbi:TraA family conjugative transfer protein [Ramlibacter humi]|uniref:Conjugal transfer protein TraB n=1 Tax=Ramlibacter humi TaxID=2530451 RepID=A0A4Z0BNU2_9BURK|nr:TraA family conjugative transfer protein [Ramlibacter humi]TFZ00090.1 conjugal transfer protein TraB [Ramlibacter humi]
MNQRDGHKHGRLEHIAMVVLLIAAAYLLLVGAANAAGTGGAKEFEKLYTDLQAWVSGYLGKLIALFAFVIGLFYGAIKQNFMMALGGVGIAIMIAVMPNLLDTVIGAVI